MRREALYQSRIDDKTVQCNLCPRQCKLTDGQVGSCRTRKVFGDKLFTISYGNPCSIHVDPIEKKPLYHFYPGSNTFSLGVAGCILHCKNCQNYTISQTSPNEIPGFPFPAEVIVKECIGTKCDSISYTYTEPFSFYEYMLDIAKIAKQKDIKNILVSSGYVNEQPLRDILPLFDAANIDLKCFSNDIYRNLCNGTLEPVLRNLKIIKESGVWLEITNLVIPDWTDDLEMIEIMCGWLVANGFENTPLHFTRFAPMFYLKDSIPTPLHIIQDAISIAKRSGLKHVYAGNVSNTNDSCTYCTKCNTLLIGREGYSVQVNAQFQGSCPNCGTKIHGLF